MTDHSDGSIPHSVLDTSGLPAKQGFELWQEHGGQYYDLRAHKEHAQFFDLRMDFWHLGNALLFDTQMMPAQDYSRSRACIGRDGTELYLLHLIRKGWNGPRDGGATARAGDIIMHDMAQPALSRGGDNQTISLFLPRSLLAHHLKAPDEHSLHVLRASDPLTSLLRDHLVGLRAQLPAMSPLQAQAIMPATVQLIAAALNGTVRDDQTSSVRMAMTDRISAYINAQILDPKLNPEAIAHQFGMTRRNLGYLFESYGGVAAHIRKTPVPDPRGPGRSCAQGTVDRIDRGGVRIQSLSQLCDRLSEAVRLHATRSARTGARGSRLSASLERKARRMGVLDERFEVSRPSFPCTGIQQAWGDTKAREHCLPRHD